MHSYRGILAVVGIMSLYLARSAHVPGPAPAAYGAAEYISTYRVTNGTCYGSGHFECVSPQGIFNSFMQIFIMADRETCHSTAMSYVEMFRFVTPAKNRRLHAGVRDVLRELDCFRSLMEPSVAMEISISPMAPSQVFYVSSEVHHDICKYCNLVHALKRLSPLHQSLKVQNECAQ